MIHKIFNISDNTNGLENISFTQFKSLSHYIKNVFFFFTIFYKFYSKFLFFLNTLKTSHLWNKELKVHVIIKKVKFF